MVGETEITRPEEPTVTIDENGELRSPYIRKPFERVRTYTIIAGESMTQQSHAETCDINNIIRRFDNTGVLPPAKHEAQYADVTGLQIDLTEAYNRATETIATAESDIAKYNADLENKSKQKQLDIEQEIKQIKEQLTNGRSPEIEA